jgi:two-component system, NtrC family, response regulator
MEKLLIIENDTSIRKQLAEDFGKDYQVLQGADYGQALEQFQRHEPKVVTLDLGLPPYREGTSEGFRCLKWIVANHPEAKVVVLTVNGDWETAHRALRSGAYDFYQKPVNSDELQLVIRRAIQLSRLEEDRRRPQETLQRRGMGLEGIVGQCPAMQRVFTAVQMVAASDVPVLNTGENGTGKELVARAIKSLSARVDGPFVPFKCGGVREELLDGELFGFQPGNGSGMASPVPGKIEHACKGTLFLDEPAQLPHQLQQRLLRLLQDGKLQRVGGGEDVEVDTRVICATSGDLAQALSSGRLREDLYYRIAVITLELPPLRARGEDIMLLAHLFLRRFAQACNGKARGFSAAAVRALESHTWPGNVRELESRVQRGVIMAEGALLEPGALGFVPEILPGGVPAAGHLTLREARDQVERKVIISAIDACRGNLAKASEQLDVSRSTLYDLLKKHQIFNAGARQ